MCQFTCCYEILLLVLIENACTRLYSDSIDSVVPFYHNVYIFDQSFLSLYSSSSNRFKKYIVENCFFPQGYKSNKDSINDLSYSIHSLCPEQVWIFAFHNSLYVKAVYFFNQICIKIIQRNCNHFCNSIFIIAIISQYSVPPSQNQYPISLLQKKGNSHPSLRYCFRNVKNPYMIYSLD